MLDSKFKTDTAIYTIKRNLKTIDRLERELIALHQDIGFWEAIAKNPDESLAAQTIFDSIEIDLANVIDFLDGTIVQQGMTVPDMLKRDFAALRKGLEQDGAGGCVKAMEAILSIIKTFGIAEQIMNASIEIAEGKTPKKKKPDMERD